MDHLVIVNASKQFKLGKEYVVAIEDVDMTLKEGSSVRSSVPAGAASRPCCG